MKYAILVYEEPTARNAVRADPERAPAYWSSWGAYAQVLKEAGLMLDGFGLQPPTTATTVRTVDGERRVQDGPFADAREELGGVYIIEAPDLDTALAWAARCPSAVSGTGSAEVRPILGPPR